MPGNRFESPGPCLPVESPGTRLESFGTPLEEPGTRLESELYRQGFQELQTGL